MQLGFLSNLKISHGLARIISCICVLSLGNCFTAEAVPIQSQDYLNVLISNSRVQGLAQKRTWRLLLHYRDNHITSGSTSEIDGVDFFLDSTTGKYDPEAELEATLVAFFTDKKLGKEKQSPQCAFPARYHWLNSQLQFDSVLMPVQKCEAVDRWRKRVNPSSVSLIFASYFLNSPASMFGHTLLRFNSNEDEKPSLLDSSISFAAAIDPETGFLGYAWKGLTGGFEGYFTVYPYYDIVKRYNNLANRDLWEYQLNLSPTQIEFMLLHIWELANIHSDFYFLRENCAYHLLSLLEVADPELSLRDQYRVWTLPAETIKQVTSQAGLVGDVIRRPSLSTQFEYLVAELNDLEKSYIKQLIDKPEVAGSAGFNLIALERQAQVIDAAIIFIQFESATDRENSEDLKSKRHALLLHRSLLPTGSAIVEESTVSRPISPDQGHDPVRFEISGGSSHVDESFTGINNEAFIELTIQPALHDLLSAEGGYAPNSQLNFLNLRTRYETDREEWQLQNFTLVDIISLYPVNSLNQAPSWKINLGWERNQDNGCADCTPLILNPGVGLTLQSNLHRREVYFGFLEANLEFDSAFDSDHRAGFGATIGLLFDATQQWRLALVANHTRYTAGQRSNVSEVELRQRFYLSRNLEVVFDFKLVEDYREGKLGIAHYF